MSNRIYEKYGKEYAKKIDSIITKRKQDEIKENNINPKLTFNIPIKTVGSDVGSDSLNFKDKNTTEITFLAKGVEFTWNGQHGYDANTEFKIIINGDEITFKSKYLDGYMWEEYVVDSIALDREKNFLLFFLSDANKVKRNSFLNPAKVEYVLQLVYFDRGDESSSYYIQLKSLEGNDFKTFQNGVRKLENTSNLLGRSISYDVITEKSYFYTFPREDSKRNAYVQKGDEVKITLQENGANGWLNATFINSSGKVTVGFLKASTLKRK